MKDPFFQETIQASQVIILKKDSFYICGFFSQDKKVNQPLIRPEILRTFRL